LTLGGRDPEKLNELAAGTGGETCPGDARDGAAVDRAVAQAVEQYGRLDGAVNLVGSVLPGSSRSRHSAAGNDTVAANLGSAFHLVRSAAKALRGQGGSVVLVSPASAIPGTVNPEAGSAARQGVEWLTLNATASYAAQKVRTNCVAPVLVRMPLKSGIEGTHRSQGAWAALQPPGCGSDPEDVAAAIAWLLDPANSRLSGQVVRIDDGLALLHGGARG
jgi:NAD(P)-dependent dehydrogenase (short-subunit alcohol dehydrogenase family)